MGMYLWDKGATKYEAIKSITQILNMKIRIRELSIRMKVIVDNVAGYEYRKQTSNIY